MSSRLPQPTVLPEGRWESRPALSLALRAAIYAVPLAAGLVAAQGVAAVTGDLDRWLGIGLTLATGVVVSWLVTGLTARLLPLAVLMRMTMLFPHQAPSRLAVARRTTSATELARRLASGQADERETATILLALVTALGRHDRRTRGHSERVRVYADLLGEELGLDESDRGRLRWAALIHDIGKLEVATRILNKAGSLNVPEWSVIKRHPEAGARLAQPLAGWLGPWFAGIAEHHEKFDGTGYPSGLKGDEISLAGRAVAVVDAFETMTAARTYKAPMATWAARAELTRCAGSHFDPQMVRAFLKIALPRVLRTVGPLAFVVNVPFLRWVGQSTARVADVASGSVASTVTAAGVSVAVVAGGGLPLAEAGTKDSDVRRHVASQVGDARGTDSDKAAGTPARRRGAQADRATPQRSGGKVSGQDSERGEAPQQTTPADAEPTGTSAAVGSSDTATSETQPKKRSRTARAKRLRKPRKPHPATSHGHEKPPPEATETAEPATPTDEGAPTEPAPVETSPEPTPEVTAPAG